MYFIEKYEENNIIKKFFTFENNNILFKDDVEDLLIIKNILMSDLNQQMNKNLIEKREKIKKFIECLYVPDSEVIYYYLKLLLINDASVASEVVSLIFKIYRSRSNILHTFNNI